MPEGVPGSAGGATGTTSDPAGEEAPSSHPAAAGTSPGLMRAAGRGAPGGQVRLVILEDHGLLAQGVGSALRTDGFEVSVPDLTAPAGLADVLALVERSHPDVVLLDLDLGPGVVDGVELVPALVARGAVVVVISGTRDRLRLAAALEAGAAGCVAKSESYERLLATTRDAAAGRPVMDPGRRHELLRALRRRRRAEEALLSPFAALTPKEADVLAALVEGVSVDAMARDWVVSTATVRSHVRGVLTKLGVASQLAAVARAREAGWEPGRREA